MSALSTLVLLQLQGDPAMGKRRLSALDPEQAARRRLYARFIPVWTDYDHVLAGNTNLGPRRLQAHPLPEGGYASSLGVMTADTKPWVMQVPCGRPRQRPIRDTLANTCSCSFFKADCGGSGCNTA